MSSTQLLIIAGSIVAVCLILKLIKGVIKFGITVAVIVMCAVCVMNSGASPVKNLPDISSLNTTYISDIKAIAGKSADTVKLNTDNGYSVSVKVNGKWIDTSEIAKVKSISPSECEIEVNGQVMKVTDKSTCTVLSLLQDAGKSVSK